MLAVKALHDADLKAGVDESTVIDENEDYINENCGVIQDVAVSTATLLDEFRRANNWTEEAAFLAKEMTMDMSFSVGIRIPPNKINLIESQQCPCELVIYVRRAKGTASYSLLQFERCLAEMRELFRKTIADSPTSVPLKNPFNEDQPEPVPIGVAVIYLFSLNHEVRFSHRFPIINCHGEVTGRLLADVRRISSMSREYSKLSQLACEVRIREAMDLPDRYNGFVFCQYLFPEQSEITTVLPVLNKDSEVHRQLTRLYTSQFNHSTIFRINADRSDRFLNRCRSGQYSLTVQLYGHVKSKSPSSLKIGKPLSSSKVKPNEIVQYISDCWRDNKCLLVFWLSVYDLNEGGQWQPVYRTDDSRVMGSGGYFKLRQGQSHRLVAKVKAIRNASNLPVSVVEITKVEAGCIRCCRPPMSAQLDSYQDEELIRLREVWLDALEQRRRYLQSHLNRSTNNKNRDEGDTSEEQSLVWQMVRLTEERNVLELPPAGFGIPGSLADWEPPAGMERHIPTLMANKDLIDVPISEECDVTSTSSPNGRSDNEFVELRPMSFGDMVKFLDERSGEEKNSIVRMCCHWDPAVHESVWLDQLTSPDTFIFIIVRAHVVVKVPGSDGLVERKLVLRKRVPMQIVKRQSSTSTTNSTSWFSRIVGSSAIFSGSNDNVTQHRRTGHQTLPISTGVTYELINQLPQAFRDLENRESLANRVTRQIMDTTVNGGQKSRGRTEIDYLVSYLEHSQSVASILMEDRGRQEVIVSDMLRRSAPSVSTTVKTSYTKIVKLREIEESANNNAIKNPLNTRSSEADSDCHCEENDRAPSPTDSERTIKADDFIGGTSSKQNNNAEDGKTISNISTQATLTETDATQSSMFAVHVETDVVQPVEQKKKKPLPWPSIGSRVVVCTNSVRNKAGTIRYIGKTVIKRGKWYGIELDLPEGKNDGTYDDIRYFECKPNHGVFVRLDKLIAEVGQKPSPGCD